MADKNTKLPYLDEIAKGFSGELGGSLEWRSIGQSIVPGSVEVERHVSKSCEWVQGGAIAS